MKKVSEFDIPFLPPSINSMYEINYRTRSIYLNKAARNFKVDAIPFIPRIKIKTDDKIMLNITYYGMFLNKGNGKTKKRDGQNLDKCLYDTLFDTWGYDDSMVWKGSWEKVHSDTENRTHIVVHRITS